MIIIKNQNQISYIKETMKERDYCKAEFNKIESMQDEIWGISILFSLRMDKQVGFFFVSPSNDHQMENRWNLQILLKILKIKKFRD